MNFLTLVCDRQTYCVPVPVSARCKWKSCMTFQHIFPEELIMMTAVRSGRKQFHSVGGDWGDSV